MQCCRLQVPSACSHVLQCGRVALFAISEGRTVYTLASGPDVECAKDEWEQRTSGIGRRKIEVGRGAGFRVTREPKGTTTVCGPDPALPQTV